MDGYDPSAFWADDAQDPAAADSGGWGTPGWDAHPTDAHAHPQPGADTSQDHDTEHAPDAPDPHAPEAHAPEDECDHTGPTHAVHATVYTGDSAAAAVILQDPRLDAEGSLSVMGVKHQLGTTVVGDYVDVWLPNGEHVAAKVTHISATDDSYRAEIEPDRAQALVDHLPAKLAVAAAHVGDAVEFDQTAGTPCDLLRRGHVAGFYGDLVALGGTDAGPGASGSPVFDSAGRFVGQVVAYDAARNVNVMVPASQVLADLDDFAEGKNLESQASPVVYRA